MAIKNVIKDNGAGRYRINRMKEVYVICELSGFEVVKVRFSGKYDEDAIPYVYQYCDENETCGAWLLKKISEITSGVVYEWTFDGDYAYKRARELNERFGRCDL